MLIRSIQDISGGEYIAGRHGLVEGPCRVVDHILRLCNAPGIRELVASPEFDMNAFSEKGNLRFILARMPRNTHFLKSPRYEVSLSSLQMRWLTLDFLA